MLSKVEAGKKTGEGSGGGKLLKDIERAPLSDSKSKPKAINEDASRKDKKSIWKWRPLKAFSHVRNQRFNCSFSLQVHFIEGLPSTLGDAILCVYWQRRDGILVTRPAKVVQGTAKFEEKLTFTCSVYGSGNGPNHSAKYEAKHFLLYVCNLNAPEHDLGKHRVDLTRLLPLTLEDLEEEKVSGKWTTSFRLSGMASGAVMNVSFDYMVVGDSTSATRDSHNTPDVSTMRQSNLDLMKPDSKPSQADRENFLRQRSVGWMIPDSRLSLSWMTPDSRLNRDDRKISMSYFGSLPTFNSAFSAVSIGEARDLHEVSPLSKSSLSSPIDILYQKFDNEKVNSSVHVKPALNVSTETFGPIKPDNRLLSNLDKQQSHECEYNEEKECSTVLDNPELSTFQENQESMKIGDCPLSDSEKANPEECGGNAYSVINQGVELLADKYVKVETITKSPDDASTADSTSTLGTAGIQVSSEDRVKYDSLYKKNDSSKDKVVVHECSYQEEDDLCTKELLMQELQSALNRISDFETVALESPDVINYMEAKSNDRIRKSHSLDEVTESVANEFLSMLDIVHSPVDLSSESEPESPRERLLRQFEREALAEGFSLFDFDEGDEVEAESEYKAFVRPFVRPEQWNFSEGLKSWSSLQDLQGQHPLESQEVRSKQRAQILEGLETEALMREWGLNEEAFQHSPPEDSSGFGSSIHLLPEEPLSLPPLADGLGPFLRTKNGGFLRSMNPSLFRNAKSGGRLIMQISNLFVVPAEMGSGIVEILKCLASVGIEKLSMQASKLMPLEDITGKTMQQIAWEAMSVMEGSESQGLLEHNLVTGQDTTYAQEVLKGTSHGLESSKFSSTSVGDETGSEFGSSEDLAQLAMDKIEALSMEGLRIQSGMSGEDAPSNNIAQSIGDISALQGKGVNISGSLGLNGVVGLQLLDIKDSNEIVDGIMGLSLTLDEWMRLDSGEIDDIDYINEHTSKILAAHHANSLDLMCRNSKGERKQGNGPSRKCGLLGNNFTVALMVQLRDPLRNYEPVGTPMLSLLLVERVFVPPKPKVYRNVSEGKNKYNHDDEYDTIVKVEIKDNKKEETSSEEDSISQFKITEVHIAGLMTIEPRMKKLWGTSSQQQSGSRWLLANGMGKSNMHILLKSKVAFKSKVQPGDTMWSISSHVYGTGAKWKELASLNPHIRNPNVIIPNETVRLS